MRLLIIILICFPTSVAFADEVIRAPFEKLPVGTILHYDVGFGAVEVRRITVNTARRLEIEVLTPIPEGRVKYTIAFNSLGIATGLVYPSGRSHSFEPHNCLRIVGNCEFTFTNSIDIQHKRIYHSEIIDGALHAQIKNDNGFVLSNIKMTFDSDGMILQYEKSNPNKPGERPRVKKLREIFLPESNQ